MQVTEKREYLVTALEGYALNFKLLNMYSSIEWIAFIAQTKSPRGFHFPKSAEAKVLFGLNKLCGK